MDFKTGEFCFVMEFPQRGFATNVDEGLTDLKHSSISDIGGTDFFVVKYCLLKLEILFWHLSYRNAISGYILFKLFSKEASPRC